MEKRLLTRLLNLISYTSILICILVCFFVSAVHASNTSMTLIAKCDSLKKQSYEQSYIDKQMHWQVAKDKVDTFNKENHSIYGSSWTAYYVQLYSMLIYLDPSMSMEEHRPYMTQLVDLCHTLPKSHQALKWHAYRTLSRYYIIDNNKQEAYNLLEETIQGLLAQPQRTAQDTLLLAKTMVQQLYCSDVIPQKQGQRNLHFLRTYHPKVHGVKLSTAFYTKDFNRVANICKRLLYKLDLQILEIFYISQIYREALGHMPAGPERANHLLTLIIKQKEVHAHIQHSVNFDYQKYQELQEKGRVESELLKQKKVQEHKRIQQASIMAFSVFILILFVGFIYYRLTVFRGTILQRVQEEHNSRQATLKEAQTAYKSQLELVRNLNHDIRVPLNSLIGFSQILSSEEQLPSQTFEEAGYTIRQSSNQLLHIINNLLSIARLEANKMSFHMTTQSAHALMCSADWDILDEKLQPTHKLHVEPQTSDVLVETDLGHVRHIIELVITDIVRQTESETIYLTSHIDHESKNMCICVQVASIHLSLGAMRDALVYEKKMSDYDDADKYYLVLARMTAKLIGAQLVLQTHTDKACFNLTLPTK